MEGHVRGVEVSFTQPEPYEWQWWRGNVEGRVSGLEATWHSLRCSHRMLLGAGTKMIQRNSVLKDVFFVSAQDTGVEVDVGRARQARGGNQQSERTVLERTSFLRGRRKERPWKIEPIGDWIVQSLANCILWIFRHSHTGRGSIANCCGD